MKLIVGLGNPGETYENTRHNVGFRVCDELRNQLELEDWKYEKKYEANISEDRKRGITLMKPQTFMNLSGNSASQYANFFKVDPADILVVYDDIDLQFGDIRFRKEGSSAGHKGVQSIIDLMGTDEIKRVKVGIGHEEKKIPTEAFVLQKFSEEEEKKLPKIIQEASAAVKNHI
jgi:PTH1 family peptidyl-tRNA hydrolase